KPNVEGRILQALAPHPTDQALEVGTGSGYLTACLAQLVHHVVSVDIIPEFTEAVRLKFKTHGIANAALHTGDASRGWGERRYNLIVVTGSVAKIDEVWRQSLSLGGRLFIVTGLPPVMEALLITRAGEQEWTRASLFETELPPLRGAAPVKTFEF
ncbi:MAG TPA: protein-L-isoaspartate O-methyltransferase, partial [Gammaproteobacteria bacterium]|nr:protein-L-isoaspartate O-methyltransferase [Gammaproteobacteria bacterium]